MDSKVAPISALITRSAYRSWSVGSRLRITSRAPFFFTGAKIPEVNGPVFGPDASRAAKVGNARLGADARSGENHQVVALIYEVAELVELFGDFGHGGAPGEKATAIIDGQLFRSQKSE